MKLKEVIAKREYKEIINNLSFSPMLITLGGSHAYGTNNAESDIDLRGVLHMSESTLLGNQSYEQFEDRQTDTVFYSFNKTFDLLTSCNPNTIEILGCSEYYTDECGIILLENRQLFLSQRAVHTFKGYAEAQLHRLKNTLADNEYSYSERQEHISNTINHVIKGFNLTYKNWGENTAQCFVDSNEEIHLKINADMKITELGHILNHIHNVNSSFNKLNKRNNKKDEKHINKHAMHLLRLYFMLCDILDGKIVTYRSKEHDLLMDIRNGKYMQNGRIKNEFFEILEELKIKSDKAIERTNLPEFPDMKKLNKLKIRINKMSLNSEKNLKYIEI